MVANLAAGMTTTDKADYRHPGGNTGCDAYWQIFDHDARAWLHLKCTGDVQK